MYLTGRRDLIAYLSLGANLGFREAAILRAVRLIEGRGIGQCTRVSSLYETEPVDCSPMPSFINAVAELRSLHAPAELLQRLKVLESQFGRNTGHNEARVLDIDIVACGELRLETAELTIPHPRYRQRLFVLVPLREVAPEFRCPVTGESVAQMIESVSARQRLLRISQRAVVFDGRSRQASFPL